MTDTNKAVQTLALDIVARIATGMGKPFEKQSRFFALPVATVLSDQKTHIRAAAIQTLTSIALACEGLDSMVHGLGTALESSNPVQRQALLQWIATWFSDHGCPSSLDLNGWASPIVACLDDRSGDVRKAAQAVLPNVIICAGFDYVMQQTGSLKPASKATAIPLIQAAKASLPSKAAPQPAAKVETKVAPKRDDPPPDSHQDDIALATTGAPSKALGVRRKLPTGSSSRPDSRAESINGDTASLRQPSKGQGTSKRPEVNMAHQPPSDVSNYPFIGTNVDTKKSRLGKDASRWINDAGTTKKELAELLQHQMESHASKELVAQLFSHDHNAVNDHVAGLTNMANFYTDAQSNESEGMTMVALANFDLPLKYVSIKAHEPQSNIISKCLDVLDAVLGFLRSVKCQLTDPEALCFIPTFVYKVRISAVALRH